MIDSFLQYWEHVPPVHRLAYVVLGMAVFWIIEGYYPLFRFDFRRWRHARVNLIFLAMTIALNLVFGITTARSCSFVEERELGLLYLLNLPPAVEVLLALMFMDFFGQYAPHWLMHKVPWMWRFHMIHHSDTHVDVTTGTRHHPGEWLFRETFTVLGIYLIGIPIAYYFLYRAVSAMFTHFNHANIRVPEWLDRPLSWVFVSPNMHKVHHHFERPLTDTNYANIFSIWDRLFGTFAYRNPSTLRYGLDVLDDRKDEDLGYLFKLPFTYKRKKGQPR